ncbi:glycosyl hydrolase family 61-domain-containing protein [Immersiella caudata]|uniref:lytic cellulose monooxygenase (C4-dehydrogenating) n=1 Tax=Immersiella caudata TaxID=314043 RepID=A0AA39U5R0_9PEZI|nr:glycosyl hydrolase family 61-domain-containing protein [Immersiella caudata]
MKGFTLLAAASAASAHTIFVQLDAGGKVYPVSHAIRTPTYDGPITNVASNDLACNGGPNPTMSSKEIITVQAGSTVKAVWRHTLTSGPGNVMDPSHKGPTLAYLKKVDNALTDTGIGGGWFKIQEEGYANGKWATNKVIDDAGQHYINIPSCIPSGQYLLRAEMIALHGAGSSQGAQLYMECAQINIVGGSGSLPSKTYSIPGIYKANDPGILVNIYQMTTSSKYVIPGPALFTCSASGTGSAPASPTTLLTVSVPEATVAVTAPVVEEVEANKAGSSVAQWQQCGGQNFAGCTSCASGFSCKEINSYYHQCT